MHSTTDYLANVLYEKQRDSLELMNRNRFIKELISDQKAAEAKPIRWTFKVLHARHKTGICGAVLLALLFAVLLALLVALLLVVALF